MIDLHLALADAIRPLRLKVGLTQAELASRPHQPRRLVSSPHEPATVRPPTFSRPA